MDSVEKLLGELQACMDRLADNGVLTTTIVTSDTIHAVKFHGEALQSGRRLILDRPSVLH